MGLKGFLDGQEEGSAKEAFERDLASAAAPTTRTCLAVHFVTCIEETNQMPGWQIFSFFLQERLDFSSFSSICKHESHLRVLNREIIWSLTNPSALVISPSPHTCSPPNACSPRSAPPPPTPTPFLTLAYVDWHTYTLNSTHWHTPTQVTIYIHTYVHKPTGQFL